MKRIFASFTVLGFLGVLAAPGCGDDTQTQTPPPAPIAIDDLGTEMAKVFCEMAFSCCDAMELPQLLEEFSPTPTNQAECEAALKPAFDAEVLAGLKEGINAGRLEYDGALARTCTGELKGTCGLLMADPFEAGSECQKVFVGKVADGGDCSGSNECASATASCVGETDTMLGKCQLPFKEGEACPDGYNCEEGLLCSFADVAMPKCIKPIVDGQPCTVDFDCASEFCDTMTNNCAPKKAIGEACVTSAGCKDSWCDAGMCAALKADGQACMNYDECMSLDCDFMTNMCAPSEEQTGPVCDGM